MKPVRFSNKTKLEREIKKEISDYLTLKGWVVVQVRNTGTFNKKTGGYIPAKQLGVADLICCSPQGLFVAIEVKRPGGKLSSWQFNWLKELEAKGGIGGVASNLDSVVALEIILKKLENEAKKTR